MAATREYFPDIFDGLMVSLAAVYQQNGLLWQLAELFDQYHKQQEDKDAVRL